MQVRGDMGAENTLLANDMILLRNASHNDRIGGRSSHNTRFDSFWRSFLKQLRNLEYLGMLKTTEIFYIFLLYLVCMKAMSRRIKK